MTLGVQGLDDGDLAGILLLEGDLLGLLLGDLAGLLDLEGDLLPWDLFLFGCVAPAGVESSPCLLHDMVRLGGVGPGNKTLLVAGVEMVVA